MILYSLWTEVAPGKLKTPNDDIMKIAVEILVYLAETGLGVLVELIVVVAS